MFPDGDLNLQEGAIFSRSLNDNEKWLWQGYIVWDFPVRMSVLTTFIVKKKFKSEPNRLNLETTNRNRTVSSEPRVTDISVNRGSPN